MTRPFDEEAAKAGAPVQTRDGCKVRILCYDRLDSESPIVGLITGEGGREYFGSWTVTGAYNRLTGARHDDLVMATVKKEGWINLYRSRFPSTRCNVYSTEAEAKKESGAGAIQVHVEWEE